MSDFLSALGAVPGPAPDQVRLALDTRHTIGGGPAHFAVLTTLGEVAIVRAAGGDVIPVEVGVRLLRAASGAELLATGTVLKRGRSLLFGEARVHCDGKLVAHVSGTFAVTG